MSTDTSFLRKLCTGSPNETDVLKQSNNTEFMGLLSMSLSIKCFVISADFSASPFDYT